MNDTNIIQIKIVKKPSAYDTLITLNVNEQCYIKTKQIKSTSIRSAIRLLNKSGYWFECSEKGLVDQILVRRTL